MKIVVAYADPARHAAFQLEVPDGTTLGAALAMAPLPEPLRAQLPALAYGVWGKARGPDHVLRDGDRVELYRPLVADPKTARRKRAAAR